MNPYQITADFERALCEYTGAPFAVAVNSCTAALQIACEWYIKKLGYRYAEADRPFFVIPKRTYVSVPQAICRAGGRVIFDDILWSGAYEIGPCTKLWDCARRFTSGMYVSGQYQCVSFSTTKILGLEQGGAILHDNEDFDKWARKMRFDGRTEGVDQRVDNFDMVGLHCIMLPSTAAALLLKLYHLPKHNEDLGYYDYPDLSKHKAFK